MLRFSCFRLSIVCSCLILAGQSSNAIASDICATPTSISGNGPFPFNLTAATTSIEGQDHCVVPPNNSAFTHDVWYCWTADCTGLVAISTCGTTPGTKAAMYINGCACPTPPPSQGPLCCNADVNTPCSGQPLFTCEVVCGQQYLFRIGKEIGFPPDSGTFTLNCQGTPCVNQCDTCCGKRPNFITNAGFNAGVAAMTQQEGISSRVIDFINMGAPQPPTGSNVSWYAPFYTPTGAQNWSRLNLGTVFGVTINNLGDVFVAHSSVYGDFLNGPGDSIGTIAGGAAGAIYKINSNTGVPSVFAVLPNAQVTSCSGTDCWPGLGNICYSCTHDSFYVSNHEDGRIYRLNSTGAILQTWKHATSTIMNGPGTDPNDTNGFSPLAPHASTLRGQRVWAVRTNADRLYYSVWREDRGRPSTQANEVWSISLFPNGGFIPGTEQLEITMPVWTTGYSNPVSDISFKPNTCCILLAERTMSDDTTSYAHESRLREYCRTGTAWIPSANIFTTGSPGYPALDSCAGGCDYDFHTGAGVNVNVWATSDAMKLPPYDPPATDPWVYGIGGIPITGGNPYSSGLMIDSNQFVANHDKFQQGSVQITCPSLNPPICEPLADGSGCQPAPCQGPVEEICRPKCILIGNDGVTRVSECDCLNPGECYAQLVPGAQVPECVANCPPGYSCEQRVNATPDGLEYCCFCLPDPPACIPTPDAHACEPFICDGPVLETCKPRCVHLDNHGNYTVTGCDCRPDNQCFAVADPLTTPYCMGNCPIGFNCVENLLIHPDGSVDLCCDCVEVQCQCPGDMNGDKVLNGADIAAWVRCFTGNPIPGDLCSCVDMDGNGIYDFQDLVLFVQAILNKAHCGEKECCPTEDLTINLNSGVYDGGGLIPVGQPDDTWNVTCQAFNYGPIPRPATVVAPHSQWGGIPGAQWISANINADNGEYCYEFCFCLDKRSKNAVLNVLLMADDFATLYLNGNPIGAAGPYSGPPANLTTNNQTYFQEGENCITIICQNAGGAPTGIIFAGSVTATDGKCCCPPEDLNNNIDTGVYDTGGGLIPVGQPDDTWTLTCAPNGNVPSAPFVIPPHQLYLTIPGTGWIGEQNGPAGWYCYEYCWCFDPRFKNPILDLYLRADDYAEVWLNGNMVGATPMGWAFNTPQPTHVFVTDPKLFNACENCVEIKVLNAGGPHGMNVKGTISAIDGKCCEQTPLSCCMLDGNCIDLAPGVTKCPGFGVPFAGPCDTPRGCCMPDGMCQTLEPHCCEQFGGTVLPVGTQCGGQAQACCIPGGVAGGAQCLTIDPACCSALYGGTPQGPGSSCQGDNNGNGVDDACEESPECHVNPATGFCNPTQCPVPGEECLARCALVEAGTGQFLQVVDCDCRLVSDCHMEFSPAPMTPICTGQNCPPGTTCQKVVTDIGGGLQKVCCECVPDQPPCAPDPLVIGCSATQCATPDEFCLPSCAQISNGVVTGVQSCDCRSQDQCHVEWDSGGTNPHCVGICPQGQVCNTTFFINPDGTEGICCECMPVPQCAPDPLVIGCSQTACQSPDEVCQPKCVILGSNGEVTGVSDCDCNQPIACHVEWDAAGGGNPHCVGDCPPGQTCSTQVTVNPDGSQSLCCVCEPAGGTFCPLTTDLSSQLCAGMQSTHCPSPVPTTGACKAQMIISNGPGAPPTVANCTCFEPGTCGALSIQELTPNNWHISCIGNCSAMPGWNCYVHVDGMPVFSGTVDPSTYPPGTSFTCRCAP